MFALLALPIAGHAAQVTTWDFRDAHVPGQWDIRNWKQVQPTSAGLSIHTNADGAMIRAVDDIPYAVNAVRLQYTHATPTQAALIWHTPSRPDDQSLLIPFQIKDASGGTISLSLDFLSSSERIPDQVGIALPAGVDLTLQKIEFVRWSLPEEIVAGWKSFWIFDQFRAYSINFLWGPILLTDPDPSALSTLFQQQPPLGWSANSLFYALLGVAALALLILWWRLRDRHKLPSALLLFLCVFSVVWLVYDLRMGLEILHYAQTDYTSSIATPVGQRTFRDYGNFYDIIAQSEPLLTQQPRYVFLSPPRTSFLSILRYFTYPSMPLADNENTTGIKNWLIYDRPDISVTASGTLLSNGTTVLATSGSVIKRFDSTSFLYHLH